MFVTPLTVRTHALPRPWIALKTPPATPAASPEEELRDAALLKQAVVCCTESYSDKSKAFTTRDEVKDLGCREPFGRAKGSWAWRFYALPLMSVNYLLIAAMIATPVIGLFLLGAITEALVWGVTGYRSQFFLNLVLNLPHWLRLFGEGALLAGLLVGTLVAVAPRLASARAFGVVDAANNRAIVVFCGSKLWENLTINALVWGYGFPLRHMGFHRAWSHIRDEVRPWLTEVSAEGQIKEIVFTGHSLGGALAQIAAFDLAEEFAISHVISMGSACIGGKGMRKRYAERKVGKDALLLQRTRHLTYTQDPMPRIPPVSLFCQVGRLHCLLYGGGLVEGSEAGPGTGFALLLGEKFAAVRSFLERIGEKFLDLATIARDAFMKWWSPPSPPGVYVPPKFPDFVPQQPALFQPLGLTQQPGLMLQSGAQTYGVLVPSRQGKVTYREVFNFVSAVSKVVPRGDHHKLLHLAAVALAVLAVMLAVLPITILATMIWYFVVKIGTGLFFRHGVLNYQAALIHRYEMAKPQPKTAAPSLLASGLWPGLGQPLQATSRGFPLS
jgi:Lipase (class 3)